MLTSRKSLFNVTARSILDFAISYLSKGDLHQHVKINDPNSKVTKA